MSPTRPAVKRLANPRRPPTRVIPNRPPRLTHSREPLASDARGPGFRSERHHRDGKPLPHLVMLIPRLAPQTYAAAIRPRP